MYYTLEELIARYITGTVLVSIQELEDEGLIQEFCAKVEKIAPSHRGVRTHQELYDYIIKHVSSPHQYYFKLNISGKDRRYCTIESPTPYDEIAHLISDVSPVDMEELLKM